MQRAVLKMQLPLIEAVERILCSSLESSSFCIRLQRADLSLGHEFANHGCELLHLRVSGSELADELHVPSPEVGDLTTQLGVLGALQSMSVPGTAPRQHLLKCWVHNLPRSTTASGRWLFRVVRSSKLRLPSCADRRQLR